MRVAHTELKDLLNKVFEGMGFPLGDYEDCAGVIAWMELHGWPILADILNSDPMPQSSAARFLYEDETLAVIDAQNNGGLIYGNLALDLAALKARNQPIATVKLLNARHCQLIIPGLPRHARRGFNFLVTWRETDEHYAVSMVAQEKYPTVFIFPNQVEAADAQLTIVCARAVTFALATQAGATRVITPGHFQDNYCDRINHGISVDERHWQQLVELSKEILVEATEESRRKGAGEEA